MPLFEYECRKCGQRTERIEKFDGPKLQKCPKCGGKVDRLVSAPAIQFKGSGWYVTDYGKSSGSSGKESNSEGSKSEGKSSEGKSSDGKSDAKSDGKSDSKSENKTESKAPSPSSDKKKPAAKSR